LPGEKKRVEKQDTKRDYGKGPGTPKAFVRGCWHAKNQKKKKRERSYLPMTHPKRENVER